MGVLAGLKELVFSRLGYGFFPVKLYHAESVLTSQGSSGQVDDVQSHEGAVRIGNSMG